MNQPNIIYIVSDDLGYADLGCYGGRDAQFGPVSPNIDRLAAGGLRFTQGYANSPVCSPTRFAIMTMRYQYRLRGAMEEPISSRSKGDTRLGLPVDIPTLPSLLKAAGCPRRSKSEPPGRLNIEPGVGADFFGVGCG